LSWLERTRWISRKGKGRESRGRSMNAIVEISVDEKGRLVVPGVIQDRLRLEPGMSLTVEEGDNGGVRLRPEPQQALLVDRQGILVVVARPVGDLEDALRRGRNLRIASLLERTGL
jgi:bifunctional DNA-binding transcriptional regulator/antitoxin component of YhaV-PrlF toxin-antitoxin module